MDWGGGLSCCESVQGLTLPAIYIAFSCRVSTLANMVMRSCPPLVAASFGHLWSFKRPVLVHSFAGAWLFGPFRFGRS